MKYITNSAEETRILGETLVKSFRNRVVCLDGEMGAGKTAFVQGCVHALGYTDTVTSPTFTLCNEYETENFKILHYDLYRISDEDDLYSIGFYETVADGIVGVTDYVFIEWAGDKCGIFENAVRIKFSYGEGENMRIIETEDTL